MLMKVKNIFKFNELIRIYIYIYISLKITPKIPSFMICVMELRKFGVNLKTQGNGGATTVFL